MGGVAIWAMHYIGNRAIILFPGSSGSDGLQLSYSPGFTALSFFIPIICLLLAYLLMGTASEAVGWVRLVTGGTFAGLSICGMHYLVSFPAYVSRDNVDGVVEGTSWHFQLPIILYPRPCGWIRCDCSCSNHSCANIVFYPAEEFHQFMV